MTFVLNGHLPLSFGGFVIPEIISGHSQVSRLTKKHPRSSRARFHFQGPQKSLSRAPKEFVNKKVGGFNQPI